MNLAVNIRIIPAIHSIPNEKNNYKWHVSPLLIPLADYVEPTSEDDIKKMNRILDMLEMDDDVQDVYHNWDE